jgi:hypothetical protein
LGQLRFLPTNILLFGESNAKNSFFYDFEERKGREMEGKRVGESMEINNLKRNRLGVFRVVFTPQKSTYCCKFIPGLYLSRN